MDSEKYIGMDVHQASVSIAVRDATGKLVVESIIETKATTILEFIRAVRGTLYGPLQSQARLAWPAAGHTRVTIWQAYFHVARIAQLATVITASARRIAMPNGRCRLDGGLSTGPTTAAGIERRVVRSTSHMICPLEPSGG
jgi:hypothetical protein